MYLQSNKEKTSRSLPAVQRTSATKNPFLNNSAVVQRAGETKEELFKAVGMEALAADSTIMKPDADCTSIGNCHGYLFNATGNPMPDANSFIKLSRSKPLAVFFMRTNLAHSGVLFGKYIVHYLIGIGVVKTDLSNNPTLGYDQVFILPTSQAQFRKFYKD